MTEAAAGPSPQRSPLQHKGLTGGAMSDGERQGTQTLALRGKGASLARRYVEMRSRR